MTQIYDVIIIGGGPAGYTAAIYSARAGLSTLVIEQLAAGGQMTQTAQIDNYPGFEDGIDGNALGAKMQAGAERFGAETLYDEVTSVQLNGDVKSVETGSGTYKCKTVIAATGAEHRRLGLEKEEFLTGRGVAYCAACDGMFYRDKIVAVVGGGNSAAADAMLLSRIAKKVYLIHRRDTLRASKIYHDSIMQAENIEPKWNSTVEELLYDAKFTGVKLKNVRTGEETVLNLDGLFISIGRTPSTELFKGQLNLDDSGYIAADESTQTNIPGVYAVGDVRSKTVRQIVTAAADGAVAAYYAEVYLTKNS